jgi:putative ABC transport system permease protein
MPRAHEVALDWRVFVFLFLTCATAALLLGLAPAAIAGRSSMRAAFQDTGGAATASRGQRRLRDGLVVLEVALAFVLAVGATLLVRELVRLRDLNAGMAPDNVLTVHVGQRMTPRTDPRSFYAIADRVAQLPGVRAAGFTQLLPLQNWGWTSNSSDFRRRRQEATEAAPQTTPFPIELRYVTPGYFQALGIIVRRGRSFTDRDVRDAPPVIVINDTLARRFFGDDDPVGVETTRGTIVGVIADVRQIHLDREAAPEIYFPIAQNWSQVSELGMSLVVAARERPDSLAGEIRAEIRDIAPSLAVFSVRTMEGVIADSLSDFTLFLLLMAIFAALAVVLAGPARSA